MSELPDCAVLVFDLGAYPFEPWPEIQAKGVLARLAALKEAAEPGQPWTATIAARADASPALLAMGAIELVVDLPPAGSVESVGLLVSNALARHLETAGIDYAGHILLVPKTMAGAIEGWPATVLTALATEALTLPDMFDLGDGAQYFVLTSASMPLGARIEKDGKMTLLRIDSFEPAMPSSGSTGSDPEQVIVPVAALVEWQGDAPATLIAEAFQDLAWSARKVRFEDRFWTEFAGALEDPFVLQPDIELGTPDAEPGSDALYGYAQPAPKIAFAVGDRAELERLLKAAILACVPAMEPDLVRAIGYRHGIERLAIDAGAAEPDGDDIPVYVNRYENLDLPDGMVDLIDEILGILDPRAETLSRFDGDRLSRSSPRAARIWYDMSEAVRDASAHQAIEAAGEVAGFLRAHGVSDERITELLP